MKRAIIITLLLVLAAGFAAPHFKIEFARPRIARALERGLGRRVEVGPVHFNLFTGPGFTVDDVTIYEDPHAGIEPFAYVGTLDARVQLLSLFRHKLEFSSLRLGEASINLVRRMLDRDVDRRISIGEVLEHAWCRGVGAESDERP